MAMDNFREEVVVKHRRGVENAMYIMSFVFIHTIIHNLL